MGEYTTHNPVKALYLAKTKELLGIFTKYDIHQLPRSENSLADTLANLGSSIDHRLRCSIAFEYLEIPSVTKQILEQIGSIDERESWTYIIHNTLPEANASIKGSHHKILLAFDNKRLQRLHLDMRKMPEVYPHDLPAGGRDGLNA
ncbi:hypothetical protein ACFX13_023493 [Malus domestica]